MKSIAPLIPLFLLISCNSIEEKMPEITNHEEAIIEGLSPVPDVPEDMVDMVEEEYDPQIMSEWYQYITENYQSIGDSIIEIGESAYGGKDICHFVQDFESNIHYEYGSCGEGGMNEKIVFLGWTKEKMYQLINEHFFTEDNTWNDDSTAYEADGAGCYYNMTIQSDTLVLTTYCGC